MHRSDSQKQFEIQNTVFLVKNPKYNFSPEIHTQSGHTTQKAPRTFFTEHADNLICEVPLQLSRTENIILT